MRVMLINPRFHLPIDTRTTPHLGLAYLAAVSEQRGDEVEIFDADVEQESIVDAIKRFDPGLVGITAIDFRNLRFLFTLGPIAKGSLLKKLTEL